jgi:hypothetical protein
MHLYDLQMAITQYQYKLSKNPIFLFQDITYTSTSYLFLKFSIIYFKRIKIIKLLISCQNSMNEFNSLYFEN